MEDQQGRRIFNELYSINRGITTNRYTSNGDFTFDAPTVVSPYFTGSSFESTSTVVRRVHMYTTTRSPPTATVGGVFLFSTVVRVILQTK